MMKDGAGISKDEINSAFDVAVVEVFAASGGIESVLPADEAAMAEDGAIGMKHERDCLGTGAKRIFKREIGGFEVRTFDVHRAAQEGAAGGFGAHVVGDDGGAGVLSQAEEGYAGPVLGDDEAFAINSGLDGDDQAAVAVGRSVVNGLLDGQEVAVAVGRDGNAS